MRVQRQKLYAVSRLKVLPRDHEMASQEDWPRGDGVARREIR